MESNNQPNKDDFRPAIVLCQICSAIYKIDFNIQYKNLPPNIIGIPDYGFRGFNCPNCGNENVSTKNGLYEFVSDTFSYLKNLGLPELIILKDAILKYKESEKSNEDSKEFNSVVNNLAPELFNIKSFIPKTSADLAAWLTLVVTIIFGTITYLQSGNSQPQTVIFNNIDNTNIVEPKVSLDTTKITSGRNDPCPCGSGVKFKKCHGFK